MHKVAMCALAVLLLSTLASATAAQQLSFTTEKISDNVYIVKGGIANTGFIVGEKEVAAIDAEMTAEQAQKMIEEIGKITPKPVTKVILTHSDGDHVNGLTGFPKGIEIISSDVARKEIEDSLKAPGGQALQAYLPNKTFKDKTELNLGTEQIRLIHVGPAHTSGDIVVFLPARKLAFVGDLVFIGRDPLIHRNKGGSSTGLIKTLQDLLALDVDRYVPGHGNIVSKAEIETLKKSLQDRQTKIQSLIREGKTLGEVKSAFNIPESPAKPGGMNFPSLVEIMYLELSEKK